MSLRTRTNDHWYSFWQGVSHYARKFKTAFLLLWLVILSVSVYYTTRLTVETDLGKLLPENTQSVHDLRYLESLLGGIGFFVVIFEVDEPNAEKLEHIAADFSDFLMADSFLKENIFEVYHEMPTDFVRSHAMLYLDYNDLLKISNRLEDKIKFEQRKLNPYLIDIENTDEVKFNIGDILQKYRKKYHRTNYFLDEENKKIAVFIKPRRVSTNIAFSQTFYEHLSRSIVPFVQAGDIRHYVTGRYMLEMEQNRIIAEDIGKTTILTVLLLLSLLILFFRSMRAAIVIGLPLLLGLTTTFALTFFIIGRVNLISAFLTAILLGLGIDYGIHLYSRYKEERITGQGISEAVALTMSSILSSIGLGALTTSAAFLTLAFSGFKAFSEFGIIAFLGVITTLISFAIFFPPLIYLTEKFSRSLNPMIKMVPGNFKVFKIAVFLFTILSFSGIFFITSIKFEYNFARLDAVSSTGDQADEVLASIVDQHGNPMIYVTDTVEKLKLLTTAIQDRKSEYTGLNQNITSLYPIDSEKKAPVIYKINSLLKSVRLLINRNEEPELFRRIENGIWLSTHTTLRIQDIPDHIRRLFLATDKNGQNKYFHYLHPENLELAPRGVLDFADDFRHLCLDPEYAVKNCPQASKIEGISDSLILSDILDLILNDIKIGSFLILLVVIILILALSRSLHGSILIGLPLLTGMGFTLFILFIASRFSDSVFFKFNYINSLAIPLLLGVGIDNGFHLFRRLRENGMQNVHKVMSETGNAVLLSNLTTVVGFGSLTLSAHNGLASLGFMAALGILSICLAYFIIFPAIARIDFQKFKKT
ncbi:MAG: MMPL family transporter [Leptospiraceae bacterium]|nr:MMPL family transporter [Leptospiraceae bacterium]